jgi:beta-glucosidase
MAEGMLAGRASMAGVESGQMNEVERIPGTIIENSDQPKFEGLLKKMHPTVMSLKDALSERFDVSYAYGYPCAGDDESGFDEALNAAKGADLAILTLGGKHGTSSIATTGEGIDVTNINLPPCQEKFIAELSKLGVLSVGIHLDGRPISSDNADQCLSAIIEAWNPSEYGAQAIVEALVGDYNPSGKMPVSVARNAGQIPVYYNHLKGSQSHQSESIAFPDYADCSHKPRYAFGHGLSYTAFEYGDLSISDGKVSFSVKNAGDCFGVEVSQIYFADKYASVTRPVMELFGFKRVELEPGEKKTVTIEFDETVFAFLDKDMKWRIELGDFDIMVGSSSDDIRLCGIYRVNETKFTDCRARRFYCL